MLQGSNQPREIKCCSVAHLVIEDKEMILDVALYEPLCGIAIRTRHDVVFRSVKSCSEEADES
jgi:hypothetical protein